MPTYLADIVAAHRARAAQDRRPLAELVENAARTPAPRDFTGALRADGLSCIAEIKRRSPSKGALNLDLQPDLVAKEYVTGGAACLSVLTDVEFFGGSPRDLTSARQGAGPPVLREELSLAALVEVHDEDELKRALEAGAGLVGVNQRDLRTFAVDHERACALAARIPAGVLAVAESGIRDADDARRLADAGYDGILVGETLVRAEDR